LFEPESILLTYLAFIPIIKEVFGFLDSITGSLFFIYIDSNIRSAALLLIADLFIDPFRRKDSVLPRQPQISTIPAGIIWQSAYLNRMPARR